MKKKVRICAISLMVSLSLFLVGCGDKGQIANVFDFDKKPAVNGTEEKETQKAESDKKGKDDKTSDTEKTDAEASKETSDEAGSSDTTGTAGTAETTDGAGTSGTAAKEPVHQHNYVGATCLQGGTCSSCGKTCGPLGHNFSPAGCATPATCKRCGATNGGALGHTYAKGRCTRCGDTNGPLKPSEAALFNNKLSDAENAQALAVARQIAAQVNAKCAGASDLERVGMAAQLVSAEYNKGSHLESGNSYNQAYGVFVARQSSCAGCCRALGLVLSCMGYQWSHVNANQWKHQWLSVTMDGQAGWADGQIGYVGYGTYPYAQ